MVLRMRTFSTFNRTRWASKWDVRCSITSMEQWTTQLLTFPSKKITHTSMRPRSLIRSTTKIISQWTEQTPIHSTLTWRWITTLISCRFRAINFSPTKKRAFLQDTVWRMRRHLKSSFLKHRQVESWRRSRWLSMMRSSRMLSLLLNLPRLWRLERTSPEEFLGSVLSSKTSTPRKHRFKRSTFHWLLLTGMT